MYFDNHGKAEQFLATLDDFDNQTAIQERSRRFHSSECAREQSSLLAARSTSEPTSDTGTGTKTETVDKGAGTRPRLRTLSVRSAGWRRDEGRVTRPSVRQKHDTRSASDQAWDRMRLGRKATNDQARRCEVRERGDIGVEEGRGGL